MGSRLSGAIGACGSRKKTLMSKQPKGRENRFKRALISIRRLFALSNSSSIGGQTSVGWFKGPTRRLYSLYIGGSVLFTFTAFTVQGGYVIGIELRAMYYVVPAVIGLAFGTLLARVHELSIQLGNAAMTDSLTGISNRRHFLAALEREAYLSKRHGYALSIAFLDVDKFKDINDTHGHSGGDKVLQGLAAFATAQCRAGDLVARWGGDEFVILLPHTDESGARVIAERLLGAIRSARFAAPDLRVTSSIGIASRHSDDTSINALIRRADSAMYRAKRMGSNRIETPPLGGADPANALT